MARRSLSRGLPALAAAAALALAVTPGAPRGVAEAARVAKPDLAVTKATGAGTVAPGGSLRVAWTVANKGKRKAGASVVQVLLSADARPGKGDIVLATSRQKALKPRKVGKRSVAATLPATTAAGAYTVLVCADAKRKVREAKEGNNCRSAGIVTVAKPDQSAPPPAPQPTPTPVATPLPSPTPEPEPARDETAPQTEITERPAATTSATTARFTFGADEPGSTFECRLDFAAFAPCTSPKDYTGLLAGSHRFEVRATDAAGNQDASPAVAEWQIAFEAPAPGPSLAAAPDPETKATQSKTGEMTVITETTAFLYAGADPIQKAVEPQAIAADRASVLRGKVTRRDGSAIAGVRVSVLDHPELGYTATRADGGFELAVNGGGTLVVQYEREGYVPSQRTLEVATHDFAGVEEIIMVPYSDTVSGVDLSAGTELQVARSAPVSDGDGTRQATLLLEPGTDATATLPDGTEKALPDVLNIRATEYTVGASGPAAMPGELPPTSAYTYAVEYSVDEASADEAVQVEFDKPIVTYVDNYLDFPAGTIVPMGYYDRQKGQWVAAPNGVVIDIVGVTGGKAQLDVDGDGAADGAAKLAGHGVDDAELAKLAQLYKAGDSLWRAAISHFTPWDYNWPYGLGAGAGPPGQPGPSGGDGPGDGPCGASGSTILCEDQVLGEEAPVAGTPYTLHYMSDRVPGRRTGDALEIPLTSASTPAPLARVDLTIQVAGRTFEHAFDPAPNLSHTFIFDGKDAYGRPVQGRQPVEVKIDYVYPAVYREPAEFQTSFAAVGAAPITANRTREEISVSQEWRGFVGGLNAPPSALAGWNVDVHHAYDPVGRTLYLGNGAQRSAEGQNFDVISTVATGLAFPEGMTVTPEGDILVADSAAHVVRRIARNGTVSVVAGTGTAGFAGDGGAATAARLNHPSDVTVALDGSMYVADEANNRVRRIALDGTISTVAGTGTGGFAGDGGAATAAQLDEPSDVAAGADGGLLIADRANHAVRRVDPAGVITTVAGNGSPGFGGDGGVATRAKLRSPRDVVVREDGAIFVADGGNHRVRRIDPDGTIQTVAGDGADAYRGDGGKATEASLDTPSAVVPLPDGGLLIADAGSAVLRKVGPEGTITTVAGNGTPGFRGDGGPAAQARLDFPQAVAVGPDAAVYVVDAGNDRVRKLAPSLPGLELGQFSIPSDDGMQLYVFDRSGRHLRTRDALTGATLLLFAYDQAGRLTGITDGDGNATSITRAASGAPSAIVGPYGHTTALQVDANGYISRIQGPMGNRILLEYTATGLLTKLTNPRDGVHTFAYDSLGRLTADTAPGGDTQTLTRSVSGSTVTVERTTAEGRTTVYRSGRGADGAIRRTVIDPTGAVNTAVEALDGSVTVKRPTGETLTYVLGPDPRFGMQAPIATRTTIETPSGRTRTAEVSRTVELSDPDNQLSVVRWTETDAANGRASTTSYERATSKVVSRSPSGAQSVVTVDDQRRPLRLEMPGIAPFELSYDARGRLTQRKHGSRTWTFTYGQQATATSETDPLGRTTTYGYDAAGRVVSRTLPGSRTVETAYDAAGNVTSITPPGRPAHQFTYNDHQDISKYTPPVVGPLAPITFSYNGDDELTQIGRPGRAVDFTRDAGGRVTKIADGTRATTFTYVGDTERRQAITADGQTVSYTYDGTHPVTEAFSGVVEGTLARSYDDEMRLTSTTVNGGHAAGLAYDVDGLLVQAGAMSITRDPDNKQITGTAVGSVTSSYARDAYGEVVGATYTAGGQVYAADLVHDAGGRLTRETVTTGSGSDVRTYAYDAAGRLQGATVGDSATSYTYDANGNRLSRTDSAGTVTGEYDAQDRLTRWGDTTYLYTPAGDLASATDSGSGAVTSYEYDGDGNLLEAGLPGGDTLDYVVDGKGRRVAVKRNGTVEQRYIYGEASGPSAELDAAGEVRTRFVYGTRSWVPDYMVRNGTAYRFVVDSRGSVRMVVNAATGAVEQELVYDEFGRVQSDSNPGFQPFGFAGGLYDRDTGFVRLGRRDYDPNTGRFTTRDPLGFDGGDTNLYAYVLADPVNLSDPNGDFLPLAGAAVLGGALIGGVGNALSAWASGCDVGAAFVSGAVGGAVGTAVGLIPGVGPVVAGAAGGLAGSLASQTTQNLMGGKDWNNYAIDQTLFDTVSGGALSKVPSPFKLKGGKGMEPAIWRPRGPGTRLTYGPNSQRWLGNQGASAGMGAGAGGAYGTARSAVCGC